ncbi:MAG: MFS transporter, partial [Rickettsiales bacterium]|nr:MFS transporter [Rickettsiales bacterium]
MTKGPKAVKSIASSLIGNALEWYEYTLYAHFATVISSLFFDVGNEFVAILATFGTFAVGLAARPIGGIIFGYVGDKLSRKKMLTFTILLMSIPTTLIGFLPTYAEIGIMAPILLVSLRIMQGLALGGEFGASCVYLYESVPQNKRGFFGTLALTGVGTGLVLSAMTVLLVEYFLTAEQIYAFAWRIPFFVSVIGSFIAFYMRMNLLESDDFIIAKENQDLVNNPFMEMIKKHYKTLLPLFGIFLTTQVAFFVIFIFGKTMMIRFLGYSPEIAGIINLLTVVSYTIATVIFGYLSDKFERLNIILVGIVLMFVFAYPFIYSLKLASPLFVITMSLLFGLLIGMSEGTLNPLTASSFPTNIRATSVAFCWNFTSIAFGGVAPIIAITLEKKYGNIDAIAYYLMAVCSI